jgi:hypothetical protein
MTTTLAHRATLTDARHAFESGAAVLVSEHGHDETRPVGPSTVTHTRDTTTWAELTAQVSMWLDR